MVSSSIPNQLLLVHGLWIDISIKIKIAREIICISVYSAFNPGKPFVINSENFGKVMFRYPVFCYRKDLGNSKHQTQGYITQFVENWPNKVESMCLEFLIEP